jgi:hypothetical protein
VVLPVNPALVPRQAGLKAAAMVVAIPLFRVGLVAAVLVAPTVQAKVEVVPTIAAVVVAAQPIMAPLVQLQRHQPGPPAERRRTVRLAELVVQPELLAGRGRMAQVVVAAAASA